jgi:hypothetical protein
MSDEKPAQPPAERAPGPEQIPAPAAEADAALPAVEGAFPPVEVDEIGADELFAPVAVDPAGVAAALPAAGDLPGPGAPERASVGPDGRLGEVLRRMGEVEARLRSLEDRLVLLEGLEKVVAARAEASARIAASEAATDRLERVFDRLARIEARLPPPT